MKVHLIIDWTWRGRFLRQFWAVICWDRMLLSRILLWSQLLARIDLAHITFPYQRKRPMLCLQIPPDACFLYTPLLSCTHSPFSSWIKIYFYVHLFLLLFKSFKSLSLSRLPFHTDVNVGCWLAHWFTGWFGRWNLSIKISANFLKPHLSSRYVCKILVIATPSFFLCAFWKRMIYKFLPDNFPSDGFPDPFFAKIPIVCKAQPSGKRGQNNVQARQF